jgi:Protein of unknown function (DUF3302)
MDSSFGILDVFAFVVFAVLIAVAVVIVVSLGKLPGQLARQWGHPQASAVNVAGWIGIATGGLLWPLALIWAFITPSGADASRSKNSDSGGADVDGPTKPPRPLSRKGSVDEEMRP